MAQNITLNASLLETNFSADSHPTNIHFIAGNKLIFNAKFGVTIKNSENENSKLLIKISSEYNNYVNEDNTYTYDATKALYMSVIDENAYFFIKKNSTLSLWKTNGTDSGTKLIKEFPNPNFMSSDFVITSFTKSNNKLFFNIYHMFGSPSRSELWISDETSAGTEVVNSLNNNSTLSAGNYTKIGNYLYFTNYNNSGSGKKIWKSNGTVSSTLPVFTGVQDDFSVFGNMVNFNGYLYFIKVKNNNSYLSYYDHINNVIIDIMILPGALYSNSDLYLQNGSIIFTNNNALWKSNGLINGTNVISSNSYPGYGDLGISDIIVFKNKIYFDCYLGNYSNYARLIYDGNTLTKFSDLFPELSTTNFVKKSRAYSGDSNYLIFSKYNGLDEEYFAFDGNSSKKIQNLIYDYDSGFEINVADTPDQNFLINAGNKKYGQEIFKFNFTAGISNLYENVNSTTGSYFYSPQELNGKLFYFGTDEYGTGPMSTDGTVSGTKRINESINVQINSGSSYVSKVPSINVNNKVYFPCVNGNSGLELCVSDGTFAGTFQVKDINPNGSGLDYDSPFFLKLGLSKFLFNGNDGTGQKLWVSDGTMNGTNIISTSISLNDKYANLGGYTFYTIYDNTLSKAVLMRTAGNQASTELFYDFGVNRKVNTILGQASNKFFILVDNQVDYWTSKKELWVSDGSVTGTSMLKSFSNPHYSNPGFNNNVTILNDKIYFFASSENPSNVISHSSYVSDGTINGTNKLSNEEFPNGSYNANGSQVSNCGNKVYFINKPDFNGSSSIWGYNNGQFSNVYTNTNAFTPNNLTCIDDNLYFLNKQYSENDIWVTNGTQGGTKVIGIQANNLVVSNTIINSLAKVNNKLFFNAPFKDSNNFNFYGNELYVLDSSQITLGTDEVTNNSKNNNASSILVFPNPTTSEVNLVSIKDDQIKNVEVYNMNGNLIINSKQVKSVRVSLDLSSVTNGIYLLKIQTEKGSVVKKVIKK